MHSLSKALAITAILMAGSIGSTQVPPQIGSNGAYQLQIGQNITLVGGQTAQVWSYGASSTVYCQGPTVIETRPTEFRSRPVEVSSYDSVCMPDVASYAQGKGAMQVASAVKSTSAEALEKCQSFTGRACSVTVSTNFRRDYNANLKADGFCTVQARAFPQ